MGFGMAAAANVGIGLATSLIGGRSAKKAAAEAQTKQNEAQQMSSVAQYQGYKLGQRYTDPYSQAGQAGLQAYGDVQMGMTEEDMMRLQEGTDAMRAMQSAQGRRKAGGSAEQLGGYASGFIGDVYNRAYGGLMERANIGQQAAGQSAQLAQGAAGNVSSAYIQGAQNQIPYIMSQAQGKQNLYATLGRLGGDIANSYGPSFAAAR